MLESRVIPVLLLQNDGLVKTVRFKDPKYVGDPINAIKIFNDKGADELIFLDITATVQNRKPPFKMIEELAGECFMPVCYGGGIDNINDMKTIFSLGIEKISINSAAAANHDLVRRAADQFGSQSVVVSIDAKKSFWGKYAVYTRSGTNRIFQDPFHFAAEMEVQGAGEILINSIDRDGMMNGYDIDLLKRLSEAVTIPVIACGGAGTLADFTAAIEAGGASAVGAGSMFVFHGQRRAVLIGYPSEKELETIHAARALKETLC